MERQAWKLIVLLLLFCYVHSPYVKAQVGNGKQITMEFKNEGLPSIFKRLQKLSGYKVLFIYDEVRSYNFTFYFRNNILRIFMCNIDELPFNDILQRMLPNNYL